MTFEELENRYYVLKGKHSAGLLSDEEFQAAVDKLTLQDPQGRWWMIGANSGKWYISQEEEWVEAEPTGATPVAEKVCPQCGVPLEEGALFCGTCGYRLVEEAAPSPYVPPPPGPKPTPMAAPPVAKRPHRGLLIGVIGLLFLCCLSGMALGAYKYLSPTKPISTGLVGLLRRPTSGVGPTAISTITATARATPAPTFTPTVTLTPDEIMSRSAEKMSGVTSAHITFEQEVVGEFTRTGWGDVMLPDRGQFQETSDIPTIGGEPVETIVIGATGYWRDDAAPGGWNYALIREFKSNPARWVPLSQYYASSIGLADETINGIDCYHLQFTVTPPPGWLGLFSGGGTGEAWIAKADYSLVKVIYDLQYQGSRESGSMNLTLELSQLNKPVSIVPPTGTTTPTPVGGMVSITATSTELMVGEVVTVTVTLHNTGPVMVGLPQFSLICLYEDDSPVLEPAQAEPVVHSLGVESGEADMAEFVFEALRPGKVALEASVNFEFQVGPEVGYEGTPFWQWRTLSSEEALEISVAEAEYIHILAVDVPDQVSVGELFVVTIRYAWSFRDKGTVGIRAEGGGGYQGMPGSPTEVTGEGEFTHGLLVLAPDTPGPQTFVVEAYGYSATSPNLTDQWETTVNVTASGGQVELDAETAEAILPSADELGVDQLAFMETVIADQGEGYGDLTDYRVFDSGRSKMVDLIVFANPDDAGRFTAQLFYDYQGMGDTPVWIDLGDQSFARQGEVWVRVDRYILWALGEVNRDQLRPSVQRLQTFAGGGP